jgi:pyridoxine 4-dehydrogenase
MVYDLAPRLGVATTDTGGFAARRRNSRSPDPVVADMTSTTPALQSGAFEIPDLGPVHRLGFGAMRLTGEGIWGEPADRGLAVRVARRAVELGVDLIDTADSYGPNVSEEILAEALYPYASGLRIATKVGLVRPGPGIWRPVGRPEYLRQQTELALRKLKTERLDLLQLHRLDPQVPAAESYGVLAELQSEGKVAALGLSNVTVADIEEAGRHFTVATVQNRYNLTDGSSEDVLDHCTRSGIGFIPWAPIAAGELAAPGGPVHEAATRLGATPGQVALAWLLRRSPVMLPIPGTGSLEHLEENLAAAELELDDATYAEITAAR